MGESTPLLVVILIVSLFVLSIYIAFSQFFTARSLRKKYGHIIDTESELKKIEAMVNKASFEKEKAVNSLETIKKKIEVFSETEEMIDSGVYEPHFDFDTSERFKEEIVSVRNKQKQLIKEKKAIYATSEFSVNGNKSEGKKMTDKAVKMTARAFNGECEAAIANVDWNNAVKMEERIKTAFETINTLNESNSVMISTEYLNLKLNELRLHHEYKDKKKSEKDEQAEIRRLMKEEQKLEQEAESLQKEEDKYQKLLRQAQAEAANASGSALAAMQQKIAKLTEDLRIAHEKSVRAKSMAQQTRAGHVYVISNIGSFGENVYKIGMTRRLEPMDRVDELGDASVPFRFDVHAMIYSEDAPALEKNLHRVFEKKRINMVNNRREFFQVSLSDIKKEVFLHNPKAEFIEVAEAREYRESQVLRRAG